jgi:hypothetical protein
VTDAYHEQVKQQLEQARRTAGGLMAKVQQLGGQLKDMTAERDRLAVRVPLVCCDERHEAKVRGLEAQLRAAEDELAQRRQAEARVRALHREEYGLCAACTGSHGVPWPCPTIAVLNGAVASQEAQQAPVCCQCGSTAVVYRNYLDQPFCCPCAECCPRPAEDRAERYRLAWQSARKRAAAADARLAELEDNNGGWLGSWIPGTLLPFDPLPDHYGAAFGEGAQPWWAVRSEEDRQRDLVQQCIADQLPVAPEPMALPSEEQMRARVRQTLGVVLKPNLATPAGGQP